MSATEPKDVPNWGGGYESYYTPKERQALESELGVSAIQTVAYYSYRRRMKLGSEGVIDSNTALDLRHCCWEVLAAELKHKTDDELNARLNPTDAQRIIIIKSNNRLASKAVDICVSRRKQQKFEKNQKHFSTLSQKDKDAIAATSASTLEPETEAIQNERLRRFSELDGLDRFVENKHHQRRVRTVVDAILAGVEDRNKVMNRKQWWQWRSLGLNDQFCSWLRWLGLFNSRDEYDT